MIVHIVNLNYNRIRVNKNNKYESFEDGGYHNLALQHTCL